MHRLPRARKTMFTVQQCLKDKPSRIVSVQSHDCVVQALQLMRDHRVRAVLVIDAGKLCGIVTQGDCAIKVLLPGGDARQTLVRDVMTADPMTVKPTDPLEACMGLMANRGFRHLPVMDGDRVVGVVSVGDVVKDSTVHRQEKRGLHERGSDADGANGANGVTALRREYRGSPQIQASNKPGQSLLPHRFFAKPCRQKKGRRFLAGSWFVFFS